MDATRKRRLIADLASLKALRRVSSVFDFECQGDQPERYLLKFHGRGLAPTAADNSQAEIIELHEVEIRLPSAYPNRPPQVRWVSPILHPNISFGGFIQFRDLGLTWQSNLSLDVIVEHLWDLARMAYLQTGEATNAVAKTYFDKVNTFRLPTDARPLRDKQKPSSGNIIRYGPRRDSAARTLASQPSTDNILVISEAEVMQQFAEQKPPPVPPKRAEVDGITFLDE